MRGFLRRTHFVAAQSVCVCIEHPAPGVMCGACMKNHFERTGATPPILCLLCGAEVDDRHQVSGTERRPRGRRRAGTTV